MFHYLFSNDFRISNLDDKMENIANLILTDSLPTAEEDKSLNNNGNTLGFYFNLKAKGNVAKIAAKGDVRRVVINFINKFQYPNTRQKQNFVDTVTDGIRLAPLRSVIKLLFFSKMIDGESGYLTREDISNFIFYNEDVAKNDNVNYLKVYNDIKSHRDGKPLSDFSNIADLDNRNWNQENRQIRELLLVLIWSGFVKETDGKYVLIKDEHASDKIKSELYDILMSNDFWNYKEVIDTEQLETTDLTSQVWDSLNQSYQEYMEIEDSKYSASVEYITRSNKTIQTIFFGPPGTGKSYNATKLVQVYHPDYGKRGIICPYVYRTTIHPDYSYYDFIGNIMPIVKDEEITYDFEPGVFTKALCRALDVAEENIPVFLIVEEMSRGNIASIFGDIFQLLDRDEYGYSEYTINHDIIAKYLHGEKIEEYKSSSLDTSENDCYKKEIYLPPNFNIIGTVNTSDQNVFVMDTAFKRRFDFSYVDIDPVLDEKTGKYLNQFTFKLGKYNLEWNDFYQKLNSYIVTDLEMPEDKQIGQFFIKFNKKTSEENYKQLQSKLLQYLWEDIHLINITGNRLFDNNYESFSSVYKAFEEHKNVFDSNFMERFERGSNVKLELAAESEEVYRTDEEV